ncbi:MAG TPA: acetate kinase [Candidatus Acidoferrales bacterium]|nr:acetate kinase [Candidatus Acidoferrales bacterium]
MKILVLNSGSSSQKISLYEIENAPPELLLPPAWEGKVQWPEQDRAVLEARIAGGETISEAVPVESRSAATDRLLDALWSGGIGARFAPAEIDIVGHRIVSGGHEYAEPAVITPGVKAAIAKMAALAPLHNRLELEGIELIEKRLGPVPQVAVFDTAFHRRLPEAAFVYPGPYEWLARGIRRYGFHGINHRYCAERAAQMLHRDLSSLILVTCHLGNGCSLAAIREGRSVDTTMGFTPLEGLMMGTRSGSVDPGILTYLMRQGECSAATLDEWLNAKSGLLGISGISSDMRQIVAAMKAGHARAKLAFDIFVHRLQAGIGAMTAVLGGIDALVFSGGIGENSPEVRAAACANLAFLGLAIDPSKNRLPNPDQDVAAAGSAIPVLVIAAQEDWAIARACWRLAEAPAAGPAGGC